MVRGNSDRNGRERMGYGFDQNTTCMYEILKQENDENWFKEPPIKLIQFKIGKGMKTTVGHCL